MAVLDYLKKAAVGTANRALNPFGGLGLTDPIRPKSPVGGFEALNPEAQAIRDRRLNAPTAVGTKTVAPATNQRISITPRPVQPVTAGVQTPVDPATQQLQQEQANLDQYGIAVAPTAASSQVQTTPDVQTGDVVQSPSFNPPQTTSVSDLYNKSYKDLGLGDIQGQIEVVGKDLEDLQNKKIDEISLVNENPWLTEGQRQDRVAAVERRYQQKEANLMNRLQLFQSTFEQGRQQAQFITQQTLAQQNQEQQFNQDLFLRQLDLADKRAEAERKLAEAGNAPLSVEDARALGVPYGTTAAEARKLGVVPQEKAQGGVVGEYQFYAQQERDAGRQPLTFDEYQTRDANRKVRIASASNAAGLNSVQTSTALKLSDDFEQASKTFRTVADSYNRIVSSSQNPSAAGDMSLIFGYMKMLDPGSTVREGEFATAQNSGAIPDKIKSAYNKAVNGKRLSDGQRTDFVSRATNIYQTELQQQQQTTKSFYDRATKLGLPPDLVVREVGAVNAKNTPAKAPVDLSKFER